MTCSSNSDDDQTLWFERAIVFKNVSINIPMYLNIICRPKHQSLVVVQVSKSLLLGY
jgi:hypothetical protein